MPATVPATSSCTLTVSTEVFESLLLLVHNSQGTQGNGPDCGPLESFVKKMLTECCKHAASNQDIPVNLLQMLCMGFKILHCTTLGTDSSMLHPADARNQENALGCPVPKQPASSSSIHLIQDLVDTVFPHLIKCMLTRNTSDVIKACSTFTELSLLSRKLLQVAHNTQLHDDFMSKVVASATDILKNAGEEQSTLNSATEVSIRLLSGTVDVLRQTGIHVSQSIIVLEQIKGAVIYILKMGHAAIISRLLSFLCPVLLDSCVDKIVFLQAMEEVACLTNSSTRLSESMGLSVFCWTVDNYFSLSGCRPENPTYKSASFWSLVQQGFTSPNPMMRKRSLFLLSHILAWCQSNPTNAHLFQCSSFPSPCDTTWWETIVGLLEILEEKQVHIIKPLLGRINTLIGAIKSAGDSGHFPWILVIFHRMFMHESKFIKKWAIQTVLELDVETFKPRIICFKEFILSHLLEALNDASLYQRSPGDALGSCPPIVCSLKKFICSCYEAFPDLTAKKSFFTELVSCACHPSWCSVALVHLAYSLSCLPHAPLWGHQALESLHNLMVLAIQTQEPFIRGAIQCFTIQAAVALTNKDDITAKDFVRFLSVFRENESFGRGTAQWNTAASFLTDGKRGFTDMTSVARDSIGCLFGHGTAVAQECRRASLALLLLKDALILSDGKHNSEAVAQLWDDLLVPCIETLSTASSRPYLAADKVQNAFRLLSLLVGKGQVGDSKDEEVMRLLHPHLDAVLHLLTTKLLVVEDVEEADVYFDFLEVFDDARRAFLRHFLKHGNHIKEVLVFGPGRSCLQHLVAWRCLRLILKECKKQQPSVPEVFNIVASFWEQNPSRCVVHGSGRLGCSLMAAFWDCTLLYLDSLGLLDNCLSLRVVELAMEDLERASGQAIKSVMLALKKPLSVICREHPDLTSKCLSLCWHTCMELKKNELFKPTLEAFVGVAFQPEVFAAIPACLNKLITSFHSQGELCTGMFNILVVHCLSAETGAVPLEVLLLALTFGPVHKKNQRVVWDAAAFVSKQHNLSVNALLKSDHLDDMMVRVHAICVLQKLGALDREFVCSVFQRLVNEDRKVSSRSSSHFHNSEVHRVKQRIWQALLVLQPLLEEDSCAELLEVICSTLAMTNQQPSVRYLQEWLAVHIVVDHPVLLKKFQNFCFSGVEKRSGSICSFLSMAVHLCACLAAPALAQFVASMLPLVVRCCMMQNFNSRVYAQVALHKMWRLCTEQGLQEVLDGFVIVEPCLHLQEDRGNAAKNLHKLLHDFYFAAFHPIHHYTLETIFYELPRLSGLTDEEWIHPSLFAEACDASQSGVPIFNPDNVLSSSEPGSWVLRASGADEHGCEDLEVGHNFQKKITPWKHASLLDEEASAVPSRQGDLIVVASLVDRPPNLGGLCRTCEIFGVSEYVMGSLKYVEDQQFRNLSVSAERWVPIREVKPFHLREYLSEKKQVGYCIIGLEQTASSRKLSDFEFPRQSVLLLGNEKEGLPAELLDFLDVCLEIPQQGMIRSLNVHVSGAICIWEYAKQHPTQSSDGFNKGGFI